MTLALSAANGERARHVQYDSGLHNITRFSRTAGVRECKHQPSLCLWHHVWHIRKLSSSWQQQANLRSCLRLCLHLSSTWKARFTADHLPDPKISRSCAGKEAQAQHVLRLNRSGLLPSGAFDPQASDLSENVHARSAMWAVRALCRTGI